ncbi:hypothetical protein Pmani_029779 [Petrolisthes manimaculis]|uniref:Uncharacterized protein n=1 Tax=Petrolisthes manimaculis TaxID=1843537 RepID=A0AAE1TU50_9EUCA|nr:hypothetical protein Pmani_029779 [Petrolisthes manimaculis]
MEEPSHDLSTTTSLHTCLLHPTPLHNRSLHSPLALTIPTPPYCNPGYDLTHSNPLHTLLLEPHSTNHSHSTQGHHHSISVHSTYVTKKKLTRDDHKPLTTTLNNSHSPHILPIPL